MQFTSIKSGQVIYPYKMYGLVYLIEVASYAPFDSRNHWHEVNLIKKNIEFDLQIVQFFFLERRNL